MISVENSRKQYEFPGKKLFNFNVKNILKIVSKYLIVFFPRSIVIFVCTVVQSVQSTVSLKC